LRQSVELYLTLLNGVRLMSIRRFTERRVTPSLDEFPMPRTLLIAQKFDPAGGVSFCTHDHEIIPQSGPMELNVFAAS
jgi:hypothetical protein